MIKKFLPTNLLGRAMLIVIFPILTFQIIMLTYYFNSLWERTLSRLARSVAAEVNMIIDQVEQKNLTEKEIKNDIGKTLGLQVDFLEEDKKIYNNQMEPFNLVFKSLNKELKYKIKYPYIIKPDKPNKSINIFVSINNQTLRIGILEDRITTSRNHVFLGWLLISTSVLIIISFLFLRNQIRPIRKLAKAAEKFGKGQDIGDFKTSGASEVRLASTEFLKMKNRITRQIEQRSLMLAGVSHDLKTPLTRMRLQSESIKDSKIKDSLNDEIKHMHEMLTEYLDFAANQEVNSKKIVNPIEALIKIKNDLHFKDKDIELEILNDEESYVNENIFVRCITNLLNNAAENSTKIKIKAEAANNIIKINIHDNGLGISDEEKNNVFKPFYRIDKSRNQNVNNSGLGLAITKSLLNSINGKITLHDSFLGGLEVAIEIQN
jgi:two-component system osmolarity sensor histidine kinase EnvZ